MSNIQKYKRQSQHKGYGDGIRSEPNEVRVAKIAMTGTVVASILTMAGVIIAALFNFPPVIDYFERTPTFTATLILPSDTPTVVLIPSETSTETPTASATSFPTETFTISPEPTFTSTPTPTLIPPKMVVAIWANKYAGNVPLTIKFSAEDSYVEFSDGTKLNCLPSTCSFTWDVMDRTNDRIIATPRPWQESFAYTFYKKGLYSVRVTVCQNGICGEGQIQVEGG
jgi:hypothetical protein